LDPTQKKPNQKLLLLILFLRLVVAVASVGLFRVCFSSISFAFCFAFVGVGFWKQEGEWTTSVSFVVFFFLFSCLFPPLLPLLHHHHPHRHHFILLLDVLAAWRISDVCLWSSGFIIKGFVDFSFCVFSVFFPSPNILAAIHTILLARILSWDLCCCDFEVNFRLTGGERQSDMRAAVFVDFFVGREECT
jgi:hypothetical protein